MVEPRLTAWLRPTLALIGLAGILTLAGCGGGSGAPNNPYVPPPAVPVLTVQPANLVAYTGVPTTVTITSGQGPFSVFSSDASVVPVTQSVAGSTIVVLAGQVTTDTAVTLTVQDGLGSTRLVGVSVKAAPILNALAFTPSGSDCGTDLCSGQAGTATVTATGAAGIPLTSRSIRFDVVYGPIGIMTTNPAAPVVQTSTVVTDNKGVATVGIAAVPNSPTQPVQLRATDVISGQQQIVNLTVVNNTVATQSPLAIVPNTATITSAYVNVCSTGFRVDYYIYGGTPPYTVASSFPTGITLVNNFVAKSGGFFEAITNGTCVNPLTFTISDAAGKQTTATINNIAGSGVPPSAPALAVSPGAVSSTSCSGKTFTFLLTGGTAPYNAYVAGFAGSIAPTLTPNVVAAEGGTINVTFTAPEPISGVTTIVVGDSTIPQKTQSVSITCASPVIPPVVIPPLNTSPAAYDYTSAPGGCSAQTSNFAVTGGTPPYTVAFSAAAPVGATIAPAVIATSGGGFSVKGLPNIAGGGAKITNITIRDSGAPQLVQIVSVTCP